MYVCIYVYDYIHVYIYIMHKSCSNSCCWGYMSQDDAVVGVLKRQLGFRVYRV